MQKNILIILGAVILIGAASFGAWKWQKGTSLLPFQPAATSTPSATPGSSYPVAASSSEPVTIKPLPVPSGSDQLPRPLINRPYSIPASFSAEAKAILAAEIADLRAKLQKDPENLSLWIDLGARYKAIDDYEAAREAWEYVSLMSPTNIVSFNNIGNLYHYELKDYARAEMNLLQAVRNDSHYLLSYLNLHDLYRLSYKQATTKASDILEQGIKANPKAIDLMVALATYYRGKENVADAKTFYERAITEATVLGNSALAASLKAEVKAMEQANVQ